MLEGIKEISIPHQKGYHFSVKVGKQKVEEPTHPMIVGLIFNNYFLHRSYNVELRTSIEDALLDNLNTIELQ